MANYQQFGGYGQRYDIKRLLTGDSFKICYQVTDGRVTPSVPFDFTYYQGATMTIANKNNSRTLLTWTDATDITLSSGQIDIEVQSFTLDAGVYFYTLALEDADSNTFTWLYGNFEIFDNKGLARSGGRTTPNTTSIEICLPDACTVNLNIQ